MRGISLAVMGICIGTLLHYAYNKHDRWIAIVAGVNLIALVGYIIVVNQ